MPVDFATDLMRQLALPAAAGDPALICNLHRVSLSGSRKTEAKVHIEMDQQIRPRPRHLFDLLASRDRRNNLWSEMRKNAGTNCMLSTRRVFGTTLNV